MAPVITIVKINFYERIELMIAIFPIVAIWEVLFYQRKVMKEKKEKKKMRVKAVIFVQM